jgi:4-hydroxy-tetrahydrodipicolinate synthase
MADTARCCFIWAECTAGAKVHGSDVLRTGAADSYHARPFFQTFGFHMFAGSLVALVTPMQPDGSIDFDAWSRLLEFHVANGSRGIVVAGSTGESATVTDDELRELLIKARGILGQRALLIANAGTSSTASSVERARWISALDLDALLVASPAYVKPTQQGLYRHFEAIAAASRVPILLYNVPGRTAVDILPATVGKLSRLPKVVGIKEALGDTARIRELVAACAPGFEILSGDDLTARDAIGVGAVGVISVTANVAPGAMADMVAAALRNDRAGATQIDQRLVALHRNLFVESNPIPVKWAVARMGLAGGTTRLPLTELSPEYHAVVIESLFAAGISVN